MTIHEQRPEADRFAEAFMALDNLMMRQPETAASVNSVKLSSYEPDPLRILEGRIDANIRDIHITVVGQLSGKLSDRIRALLRRSSVREELAQHGHNLTTIIESEAYEPITLHQERHKSIQRIAELAISEKLRIRPLYNETRTYLDTY